jgi:NAD(P)-dependent dehydrogenase (short-subunit alcohol dehydrogenase family)
MPTLAAARVANAAFRPVYGRPIAVVVGGTGGIGAAITQTLARHLNGDLDVVLVGRSASGARAVLDSLPSPSAPQETTPRLPTRSFVECDATRMRDVARATHEIRGMLPRVNFLVLTPGVLSLGGRDETDEGIDRKLALHYYARWKFIHECVARSSPTSITLTRRTAGSCRSSNLRATQVKMHGS